MGDRVKRKMTITSFELTYDGTPERDLKIYTIFGCNEAGEPLPTDPPLKTFWEPGEDEIGKLVEYEVEPYKHEKFGLSYTVYRIGSRSGRPRSSAGSGGGHSALDDMRDMIAALASRVDGLVKDVEALKAAAGGAPPLPPAPAGPAAPDDDDIPFAHRPWPDPWAEPHHAPARPQWAHVG